MDSTRTLHMAFPYRVIVAITYYKYLVFVKNQHFWYQNFPIISSTYIIPNHLFPESVYSWKTSCNTSGRAWVCVSVYCDHTRRCMRKVNMDRAQVIRAEILQINFVSLLRTMRWGSYTTLCALGYPKYIKLRYDPRPVLPLLIPNRLKLIVRVRL